MNSISYLKTKKDSHGLVVGRFSPAMAVAVPVVATQQPDSELSGRPAAAAARNAATGRSRP